MKFVVCFNNINLMRELIWH